MIGQQSLLPNYDLTSTLKLHLESIGQDFHRSPGKSGGSVYFEHTGIMPPVKGNVNPTKVQTESFDRFYGLLFDRVRIWCKVVATEDPIAVGPDKPIRVGSLSLLLL